MKKTEIDVIRTWKDSKYKASLSADQLKEIESNPVGEALEALEIFKGGINANYSYGGACGWVTTISGECTGSCCNPFYSAWFNKLANPGLQDNPGLIDNPNSIDKIASGGSV